MLERELREMGFVPRWSLLRNIRQQSQAEHSWFVAVYALQIAHIIGWSKDTAGLLARALFHDLGEVIEGDPPGPVKHRAVMDVNHWNVEVRTGLTRRFGPDVTRLAMPQREEGWAEEMAAIIKVADGLDALFYLLTEAQMGNGSVEGNIKQEADRLWGVHIPRLEKALGGRAESLRVEIAVAIGNHRHGQSKIPSDEEL